MKIVRLFFLAIPLCGSWAAPHVIAGDLFLQKRVERSRCHIPNYDYQPNRNAAPPSSATPGPANASTSNIQGKSRVR